MVVLRVFAVVILATAVTAAQVPSSVIHNTSKSTLQLEEKPIDVLIIGGTYVQYSEVPHMAAIGYKVNKKIRYLCGGSLISMQWVMTAGHCAKNSQRNFVPETVRLGDISPEVAGDHPHAQDFGISRVEIHPDYQHPLKYNDIALIKLDNVVQLNEYVGIACINKAPTINTAKAVATGWGKTESENFSQYLLKVDLPLTNQNKCEYFYKNLIEGSSIFKSVLPRGIIPTMLCAGYDEGGRDTCQGDSGGPLQIKNDNGLCKWTVVGITSFGNQCAKPNTYAVYTRVSSFFNWINKVVDS